MLSKHVDAIALAIIAFVLLALSNMPDLRIIRNVHAAGVQYQNAVGHVDDCPWSRVFAPRIR